MRLKEVHLKGFKRFTDTHFQGLPETARLIVLAGPNGSGKSSLFDGLKTWHWSHGRLNPRPDETYEGKVGEPPIEWNRRVNVVFHEPLPAGAQDRKKLIYIRTAFRNEAEFNMTSLKRVASPLDNPKVNRLIDIDMSVSENFQRLVLESLSGLFGSELPDSTPKGEVRDRIIGQVHTAMQKVFPDLVLQGVGGLVEETASSAGTFYFAKGTASGFLYKNLSAGEKAAFDLILDAVVKKKFFDNSIWCIDEPEAHLNTRIQATLLRTLVELLPVHSQMVLASHSIGFMREAWEMAKDDPSSVCFLDMEGVDFDAPQVVTPTKPSRAFWSRTLDVALGDLASLIAPEHIVLCEGKPGGAAPDHKAEFDASCYRIVFAEEFPNTDFLSVGNSDDVSNDRLGAGQAISAVNVGTRITRLVDRDLMTDEEVEDKRGAGVRVLSRRNIESFLLADEVLSALCASQGQPGKSADLITAKDDALAQSISRGNDPDDLKKIGSQVHLDARRMLTLQQPGSDWTAFAKSKLAPLITPGTQTYQQLKEDIFGVGAE